MTEDTLYTAPPQIILSYLLETLVRFSQEKKSDLFVWPLLLFPIAVTCNLSCLMGITFLLTRVNEKNVVPGI